MSVPECRVCIVIAETPRQLGYLLVYSSLYGRSPDRHCLVGSVSGGLGCTSQILILPIHLRLILEYIHFEVNGKMCYLGSQKGVFLSSSPKEEFKSGVDLIWPYITGLGGFSSACLYVP